MEVYFVNFTSDLEKKILRKIIAFSLSWSEENLHSRSPKNTSLRKLPRNDSVISIKLYSKSFLSFFVDAHYMLASAM